MKQTIIGIHGAKQSGKDTLAKTIKTFYQERAAFYAFADPIYRGLIEMLGPLPVKVGGDGSAEYDKDAIMPGLGVTLRECLISLGTGWGRNTIGKDVWVLQAKKWYEAHKHTGLDVIVFTDVRQVNCMEWIKSIGGIMVMVDRGSGKPKKVTQLERDSEPGLPLEAMDYVIQNKGTLDEYVDACRGCLASISGEYQ